MTTKTQTFEKYLEDVWEPEGVLDDDMPDAFEAWICELDTEEVMDYADDYGDYMFKKGIKEAEKIAQQEIGDAITKQELEAENI